LWKATPGLIKGAVWWCSGDGYVGTCRDIAKFWEWGYIERFYIHDLRQILNVWGEIHHAPHGWVMLRGHCPRERLTADVERHN
jgi:hypothetical protein